MLSFGWWKLCGRTSASESLGFFGVFFLIILVIEPLQSRPCAISCYGHNQTDVIIAMTEFMASQEPCLYCQIIPYLCFWPIRASKVHRTLKGEEFPERSWSFQNCSKVEDSTSYTGSTWPVISNSFFPSFPLLLESADGDFSSDSNPTWWSVIARFP